MGYGNISLLTELKIIFDSLIYKYFAATRRDQNTYE
jgi:hypothetical protein